MSDITIQSFDKFYSMINAGWNPAEDYTSDYEAEHEIIHIMMKARLHELLGGKKDGDFNYEAFSAHEDGWTTSRVVGAYFNNNSFLRRDLIVELQKIVYDFPKDYLLHISAEDFEPDISDFELIITKTFTWYNKDIYMGVIS